jgi:hypothetical protein
VTLTEEQLEKIKKLAEKVRYGKLVIMLDPEKSYVDIISEQRERVETRRLPENENRLII